MKMTKKENIRKTSDSKSPGKGGIVPPGGAGFDVSGQPSPESKKLGWAKRKSGRDLIQAFMESRFIGTTPKMKSKVRQFAEAYGLAIEDVSVELMAIYAQVEKAVNSGDSYAFKILMDRLHGYPKHTLAGDKDNPLHGPTPPLNDDQVDKLIAELKNL
jgi:hypothetical protein